MRFSLSTVIVALLVVSPAMAQSSDSAKARAQAALALSRIKHESPACVDCETKAKAALILAQRQRERGACVDDVGAAMDRAAKEGKFVFIWVGMTCHDEPALRAEFPGVVHCHADNLNGNATPRLLVGPLPDGTFQPMLRSKISERSPAAIRDLLNKQVYRPASPVSMAPVMRAVASC